MTSTRSQHHARGACTRAEKPSVSKNAGGNKGDKDIQAAQSIISAVPSAAIQQCKYTADRHLSTLTIGTEEKKFRLAIKVYNVLF